MTSRSWIAGTLVLVGTATGFFAGIYTAERTNRAGAEAAILIAANALEKKDSDGALRSAFAAIDRNPDLYSAYEAVADAFLQQGQTQSAYHYLTLAIDAVQRPRDSSILGNLSDSARDHEIKRLKAKASSIKSSG